MPRFAAILPEGRLLLKNIETGETLTISATDGPVSLGTLRWSWDQEESVACGDPVRSLSIDPSFSAPSPMRPEDYVASEWNPADPTRLTAEAEMRAILAAAQNMRTNDVTPAAKRVLSAPMSALTQKDFEDTYMALGKQSDEIEREIQYLEEIEADEEDLKEMRMRLEAIDRDLELVTERMKQFEAVHQEEEE